MPETDPSADAPPGARADPRTTPARGDVAAAFLKGRVSADRFVEGVLYQVTAGVACVRRTPEPDGALDTQCLFGETFTVFDERDGFGWGQTSLDGYVGYVDMACLSAPALAATDRVTALRTYVFSAPSVKSAPMFLASLNAQITAEGREGRFVKAARAGWIFQGHLAAIDAPPAAADWVAAAERFLGAPYQWGGKESLGLDCSGLVQTALQAGGRAAPRDSDMMERDLGRPVAVRDNLAGLARGDLVFWAGHVGIMLDPDRMLHATAAFMEVVVEPLTAARARIIAAGGGDITAIKRL
jgi:cell wall-associated NlpC family hydrolase